MSEKETAIVIFNNVEKKITADIEIPLNITANDLVIALNTAFNLGIDTTNIKSCFLKSEDPIALLKGNKRLSEFGIRNGSTINFTE